MERGTEERTFLFVGGAQMNTKPILERLLKLIGTQKQGVYRVDCGKYTILWRDAILNEGMEALVVGPTEDLCKTCGGDGEIPGSWAYYPCVHCDATGFVNETS